MEIEWVAVEECKKLAVVSVDVGADGRFRSGCNRCCGLQKGGLVGQQSVSRRAVAKHASFRDVDRDLMRQA
jgi:hypothetical protein